MGCPDVLITVSVPVKRPTDTGQWHAWMLCLGHLLYSIYYFVIFLL